MGSQCNTCWSYAWLALSGEQRDLPDLTPVSPFLALVASTSDEQALEDPTVGLCLGSWGGPRGLGAFLWARYSCMYMEGLLEHTVPHRSKSVVVPDL